MEHIKRPYTRDDNSELFDDDDDDIDNTIGSPTQSCQLPDRKRRRGIIEKKRRDRINHSLSELKRLVPAAFEKQGSTKLEKAEILKMTVDHLKMLQAKGGNTYGLDTTAIAMDFRSIGFRECAAEVARYLAANEGLDSQDPLRLRLLSHLQYYSAHSRSSSSQQSTTSPRVPTSAGSTWGYPTQNHSSTAQYSTLIQSYPIPSHRQAADQQSSAFTEPSSCGTAGFFPAAAPADEKLMTSSTYKLPGLRFQNTPGLVEPNLAPVFGGGSSHGSSYFAGLNGSFLNSGHQAPSGLGEGMYPGGASTPSASSLLLQCVKPYRPWGRESFMSSLMPSY